MSSISVDLEGGVDVRVLSGEHGQRMERESEREREGVDGLSRGKTISFRSVLAE